MGPKIVQRSTRMIQDLKFSRCLEMAAHLGISETTHIDWVGAPKKEPEPYFVRRRAEVVRSGGLRHFERFRQVAVVESFECPQCRQVTRLNRGVLGVALFQIRHDLVSWRGLVHKRSVQRQVHRSASRLRYSDNAAAALLCASARFPNNAFHTAPAPSYGRAAPANLRLRSEGSLAS